MATADEIQELKEKNNALTLQLSDTILEGKITTNTENIKDNAQDIADLRRIIEPVALSVDSPIVSTRNANIRNAGLMAGGGGLIALMIEIMKVILKAIGG